MSVFLKIFLSVVTVTVLSFSVCGHIIIDSEFHSNLNNEFEKSKTENLSLRSALALQYIINRTTEISRFPI